MTTGRRQAKDPVDRLVVVGASAGGIEAVSVMVAGLPHLLPGADRRGAAPPSRPPVQPGGDHPAPNRDVAITDHTIHLDAEQPDRPKPSIDRLLETASEIFGERLVAVILSGTGSDGAAGAQYVAAGGTVIVQDPDTAAFPGMPRSLLPQTVDAVT